MPVEILHAQMSCRLVYQYFLGHCGPIYGGKVTLTSAPLSQKMRVRVLKGYEYRERVFAQVMRWRHGRSVEQRCTYQRPCLCCWCSYICPIHETKTRKNGSMRVFREQALHKRNSKAYMRGRQVRGQPSMIVEKARESKQRFGQLSSHVHHHKQRFVVSGFFSKFDLR